MNLDEIRRKNLRTWIDTDPVSMGNVENWCSHYSQFLDDDEKPLSPTYIRQLAPKRGKPNRNIGEDVARKLERIGNKGAWWMDVLHEPREPSHADLPMHDRLVLSSDTRSSSVSSKSSQSELAAWPFEPVDEKRFYALSERARGFVLAQLQAAIVEAEKLFDSENAARAANAPRRG